jgi:hypothetical protein
MAVAVVVVEVEAAASVAAASVAAMDIVPLHRAVLRWLQAATAPPSTPGRRRRHTPQGLYPTAHPRRHSVFRRRHLQRSNLAAASSSVFAALQHKRKVLGSSPT